MSKKHWPSLSYLTWRLQKHTYEQYAEAKYQQELIEERRRARDGVRVQSLQEFQAGLAKSQILARIPGTLYEWSQWITPSREFTVKIFDGKDGGDASFSVITDMRGYPIGLFERETFKLDHFISWVEFLECYESWSVAGIPPRDEEGPREPDDDARGPLVIATIDVIEHGTIPVQPHDGIYGPAVSITWPAADMTIKNATHSYLRQS